MWPRRDLTDLLGIEHPIIQAPMASYATPELAAAVANAGGLGSLGTATSPVTTIREMVDRARALTNRPFNVNLFAHAAPTADPARTERMRQHLAPFMRALGVDQLPEPGEPYPRLDQEHLDLLLELRPAIVSFHFGLPAGDAVGAIKATGTKILCSATTVAEAVHLERAGVDAVIAQGFEAGGHRGWFLGAEAPMVGTLALVPQVVDAVSVPVIAAGGIMDGRGIAAAFALGASAVQMGTAFLTCPEAAVPDVHRQALRVGQAEDSRVTRLLTGRPARALRTPYLDQLAAHEADALEYPLQLGLIGPLRQAAQAAGNHDFTALWAGQAAPLVRDLPAGELVETLVREAEAVWRR